MWNPDEMGNHAWLSKQASLHGGVDKFIKDIHFDGFVEGQRRGRLEGVGVASGIIFISYGTYRGIKFIYQKQKAKKQLIKKRAEESKIALQQICETAEFNLNDGNRTDNEREKE